MSTAADAAKDFNDGPAVPEAVRKLLEAHPLAKLCEALGNAQPAQREVLIVALERLAGFDEVCGSFLGDASTVAFLRQGAASSDDRLTRLAGRLLERLASSDQGTGMLASTGLFEDLANLLVNQDVGTGEAAGRSLCRAAAWPSGRDCVIGANGVVQHLQSRLPSVPETQQIRILNFFVELGRSSESDIFHALVACGAFKCVLGAFLTTDILLKLNGVELMDNLGSYQAGQQFLSQHGVPEQLAADLTDPCCDDSVKLCVVRLLGFVLLRNPAVMQAILPDQRSPLAQAIAVLVDSRDQTQRLVGLQAVGNIAAHQSGMELFLRWPEVMNTVIAMAHSPQNEICKEAMTAWTSLLSRPKPPEGVAGPDADIWKLAEQQLLKKVLTNLSEKPFPDVRACSWKLLAAFVCSQDAARKMLVADEMREKLLDFTSETASEAKIAKHDFVRALVKHQGSWLAAFLDENIEMTLAEFAKQGPFWMPQVSSVAVGNMGSA